MTKSAKIAASIICTCLLAFVLSACGQAKSESAGTSQPAASSDSAAHDDSRYTAGIHHATVQVKGYPAFTIELDADAAPITVANFCNLVEQGYYDGLGFYRIADGFVIQGGTLGNIATGNDASLEPITGEFAGNGINNPLADAFDRGTVSMARTSNPDSATSTFFITIGDASRVGPSLNGLYAAFGTVTGDGMNTVDQIVADYAQYAQGDRGIIDDEAHMPIIESIAMVD